MKSLFKVVFVLFVLFTFAEAKAQISAGLGVYYGTDINNIGFSINGKYQIDESWSAAPSFTLFLKKDYVTWSALDLDANYKIVEIEKGGLHYFFKSLKKKSDRFRICRTFGFYFKTYINSGYHPGL